MEPNAVTNKAQPNTSPDEKFNPFPGLRPFKTEESHLFFGREGQSQEVLKFLAQNRFVALLGTSGSGKSSLMYCGVIPILQGGFITKAGADWQIITCRPGQNPVRNLANSLTQQYNKVADNVNDLQREYVYSTLTASSVGLVEVLNEIPRKKDQNILLLVDQFEELFRFRKIKNSVEAYNEVLAYIKLLLEVLKQKDVPAYIVITMRSDFIGECAQFQELTQLINDSHYLIPQMTRDDFRQAIEGPIAVGGGEITPFLTQQLLNDIGDNPDQLPILQHALMRTWEYWIETGRAEEPISIKDYEEIGRLEKALSEHANEAFNELNQRQKEVCQSIFKTLTEKGGDNRGVRRPTPVAEIAEIAVAETSEVIEVINHFRVGGRSFLTPPEGVELTPESVVDISHESLMRIWDKLIIWVSEEYEAVQMYKRLADSAEKYQLGETGLWRPPDLQLAINWREKQKPTLTWAKRHNPAFERTMVYLETSYREYQLEEENKIKQQKRALRRTRMFAVVLGTASIISIFFMINSFIQKREADAQTLKAQKQTEIAENQRLEAEKQKQIAEAQRLKAQESEKEALEQKELAELERKKAERNAREAQRQQEIANQKSMEASQQRELAELSAVEAKKQQELAEKASQEAQKLRMLSISQSMAVKSLQIDIDTLLRGLVAYQAYLFNNEYDGNTFNPDVYNGLYYAQKYFYGNDRTDYVGHEYQVRAMAINESEEVFYSTGSDGKIIKWDLNNTKDSSLYFNTQRINRTLALDNTGRYLIAGINNGDVISFNLTATPPMPELIHNFGHPVNGTMFNNSRLYAFDNKNNLIQYNHKDKALDEIENNLELTQIIQSKNGYMGTTKSGLVAMISSLLPFEYKSYTLLYSDDGKSGILKEANEGNIQNQLIVNAIAVSNDSNYLALGDISGNIMVFNSKTLRFEYRLTGHTARINSLKFSNNSQYLASGSNDGAVLMWNTADFNMAPYRLTDNNDWVTEIKFIGNNYLLAAYKDGKIRKWPVKIEELAQNVKDKITRNFTVAEWEQYVAKDIDYQKTIPSIQKTP